MSRRFVVGALTHDRLLELVDYNSGTGLFHSRVARGRFPAGRQMGYLHHTGYIIIGVDGRDYQASRLAWFYVYGVWPVHFIDHKDTNRVNNIFDNLREATDSQNGANRGVCRNASSGAKGVRLRVRASCAPVWVAQIRHEGAVKHLGHFEFKKDAVAAYAEAAARLHGEFARAC